MSFITPAAVKAIALSVDVTRLTEDAAKALAPDVEYRLREIIQDALKFARHCKRTKLTTQDINNAMRLRNLEPLHGFLGNNDPAKFVRATGHPDVYFVRDAMVPLEQITYAPLPKAPNHTTVMPHWLFIDGVQPQTEENAAVERPPPPAKRPRLTAAGAMRGPSGAAQCSAPAGGTLGQQDGAGGRGRRAAAVATAAATPGTTAEVGGPASPDAGGTTGSVSERVQLPVQHILSDEMQRLLEQIKQILATAAGPAAGGGEGALWGDLGEPAGASAAAASLVLTPMQRAILVTMQTDPGMQQLLPYLAKYVCDDVAAGLRHLPRLHMVLRVVQALLLNASVHLEPYLHQLMPPLLTCCMAKALGPSPTCDHWRLRDSAAALVAQLCGRFGEPFYSLKVKVSKQLLRALLDGSKPLTSHYGAVVGLAALGHATVRLLLLPQLEPYLAKLQPALEARKEGLRQYEATRVYGALLTAAGAATYDKLVGAAADGLLPVHLFRAGRTHLNVPALAGSSTSQAQTQQQQQSSTTVPPPHPNPELEALWEQLRSQNGGAGPLVQVFNVIVADPAAPTARSQLEQLRGSAADPSQPSHKAAQALLYQLAKRGVGLPTPPQVPQGKVNGAAVPASGSRSQSSGGGGANATNSNAKAGTRTPTGTAMTLKAGNSGGGSGCGTRSARAILAESWREDADPGEVVWALTEVLGPPVLAWLPQPPVLAAMNI
ncbi:hypothetical protein Vretimale_8389 [Volvox reticuliferus]|uniref:TATA box binding protein associated factor (TAF) histone-like fold domain-containing protein n=1 Tax=Volvox reticuliferus TaxID=1737510 RepID=A0A8J4LP93_9CHLO|nr:hypothetical protein Vretifemale_11796 [Volvox reticuliferus]GIM03728.1 hypothetical protein Vretimale_8389 [Volvox reticuliferus]